MCEPVYLEHEQKQEIGVGYALKLLEEILWQESDDAVFGRAYVIGLHNTLFIVMHARQHRSQRSLVMPLDYHITLYL